MVEVPEETGERTKPCRACRTPIPAAANKCVTCSSVQNWERYLSLSGSILGLLVALVSVSAFALPIIKNVVDGPPKPKPSVSVVSFSDTETVALALGNSGLSSAVLKSTDIYVTCPLNEKIFGGELYQLKFRVKLDVVKPMDRIVKPNEMAMQYARVGIDYYTLGRLTDKLRDSYKSGYRTHCYIDAVFADLDGKDVSFIKRFDCRIMNETIRAAVER